MELRLEIIGILSSINPNKKLTGKILWFGDSCYLIRDNQDYYTVEGTDIPVLDVYKDYISDQAFIDNDINFFLEAGMAGYVLNIPGNISMLPMKIMLFDDNDNQLRLGGIAEA